MAYLIGTDEAGYGPNLGPLVIATSVWRVPDELFEQDLYKTLGDVVVSKRTEQPGRLAIADSKQLYQPGRDLLQLERGVLTLLATHASIPSTWRDLRKTLCMPSRFRAQSLPWDDDTEISLPTSSTFPTDDSLINAWRQAERTTGVQLVTLRADVIDAEEFNDGVARYDSKGALLSNRTLDLIADVLADLKPGRVRIVCDKHGGRNKYGSLLQPRFDAPLVRVVCEGRRDSTYDVGTEDRPIRISFRVGGESFLPAAIASMLAKYLRELSMMAFNRFWQRHLPTLRPTAGYPVDAKRYWEQIRPIRQSLGIDDKLLWRCR